MKQSRMFEIHRDHDVSGVSGTGVVADGIEFPDGSVALRWRGEWPTSVVFHDRGIEAVKKIHGHSGSSRVVFLEDRSPVGVIKDLEGLRQEISKILFATSICYGAGTTAPEILDACEATTQRIMNLIAQKERA